MPLFAIKIHTPLRLQMLISGALVSVVSGLSGAVWLSARHGNGVMLPRCSCRGAFQGNA